MASVCSLPQVPGAVSELTERLVQAPPRPARVLAAFPTAVYLALEGHDQVLPVLTRDALLLPTALRLTAQSHQVDWQLSCGDRVEVGGGLVRLPRMTIRATRAWRPVRVTAHGPLGGTAAARALLARPEVDAALRARSGRLAGAVLAGRDPEPEVRRLVGGGRGLTPSGDDALCGVLLALRGRGLGEDRFQGLAGTVHAAASTTTSLSASLLRAASAGYAVADVVRLVTAACAGDEPGAAAALPAVLTIGHSSGADLVAGVLGTLDAFDPDPSRPSAPAAPALDRPILQPEGARL